MLYTDFLLKCQKRRNRIVPYIRVSRGGVHPRVSKSPSQFVPLHEARIRARKPRGKRYRSKPLDVLISKTERKERDVYSSLDRYAVFPEYRTSLLSSTLRRGSLAPPLVFLSSRCLQSIARKHVNSMNFRFSFFFIRDTECFAGAEILNHPAHRLLTWRTYSDDKMFKMFLSFSTTHVLLTCYTRRHADRLIYNYVVHV